MLPVAVLSTEGRQAFQRGNCSIITPEKNGNGFGDRNTIIKCSTPIPQNVFRAAVVLMKDEESATTFSPSTIISTNMNSIPLTIFVLHDFVLMYTPKLVLIAPSEQQ